MYYCLIKQNNQLRVVSAKEQMSLTDFDWISDHNTIDEANLFLHIANIKTVKKELGITNKDIAEFFGYKNEASYYHASRRKDIEAGIVAIYELIKNQN